MKDTHISWDYGVLAALDSILQLEPPKTTKTLCKKRVGIRFIDNTCPTCSACIGVKVEEEKMAKELEVLNGRM